MERELPFADQQMTVRDMLWGAILMHLIHHRGQLLADVPARGRRIAGHLRTDREEMAAMREKMRAAKV